MKGLSFREFETTGSELASGPPRVQQGRALRARKGERMKQNAGDRSHFAARARNSTAGCRKAHGTRLFYELLSCGEPFRRMGRGGWPAMRSLQQWMASLWAARRIFLSRSKPTRKID